MSRPPAGGHRLEHTTPQLSPINPHFSMDVHPRNSLREGHMNPPVSLPPLRPLSSTPPTPSDRRLPDPFRAILNPQAELVDQQRDRKRSASQLESPSPVETHHSQSLPSISRPTSVDSTQDDQQNIRSFQQPVLPRHMLSPKTSRIQRTANAPTGTIDAQQSPFLNASTRPSDTATSQTALPTPPIASRGTYFTGVSSIKPTPPPHAMRQEVRRPSGGFPPSGSASPSAQYSPYSQPASVESSQYDSSTAPPQYVFSHSNVHMHDARTPAGSHESERNMIPMNPSGQSSIQLMTIKSQQGHPVQIPVDVQAASKVADEKRRRNAGASARFRARRKEKEREASNSISRLEQQLRNALEDAEYYRTERDYFKSFAFQQPHPERHYARPPSPRLRRVSVPSLATSSPRGESVDSYLDYEEEQRESERNVRRRTSNYHVPSGLVSADLNSLESSAHNRPGPVFSHGQPTTGPNGHQPQQLGYRDQAATAQLQHPHPERSVYREPYSTDHGRFEHRSWPSGQHPHRES